MRCRILPYFLVVFVGVMYGGCKKDEISREVFEEDKISFHFINTIGSEPLIFYKNFKDQTGRSFNLTLSSFFISGITFEKTDSSQVIVDDVLLVQHEKQVHFVLDTFFTGEFKAIKFAIGIPQELNHNEPSEFPAEHPLANAGEVNMHFGFPSAGYIFLKLEGAVDTSATANGLAQYPLEIHIGSDQLLRTVEIQKNFSIKAGMETQIKIQCDNVAFLNGLQLANENTTHTFDNQFLAAKIAANIPQAFSLASYN